MSRPDVPSPEAPSFRRIWISGTVALLALAALVWQESPLGTRLQEFWFDTLQVVSPRTV